MYLRHPKHSVTVSCAIQLRTISKSLLKLSYQMILVHIFSSLSYKKNSAESSLSFMVLYIQF